jgi:hypothetical protein
VCWPILSLPKVYFYRRAVLVFWNYMRFSGQAWNFRERGAPDRRKTFQTCSSAWRAWYLLHVAKMLAGVGRNERWFRIHSDTIMCGRLNEFWWVNFNDALKGCKSLGLCFFWVLDDDFVWQAQYFRCFSRRPQEKSVQSLPGTGKV